VFTGALSPQAASDALACAGVIVLPYREGASLRNGSLLAALQVGRPVVTTASGYASDIEPLAALPQLHLVPAGDIDALRRAIVTALHTSTGALPLPDVFGWESIAERHRDLYASIVTRHSP
jgi:glycosyltransferase involved in cell wall biosynthesis